jgi:hypothetical protein
MAYTTAPDSSAHFQSTLYTGNASTLNVVNGGNSNLQPDWVWLKNYGTSGKDYGIFDSTRGTTKMLSSNNASAQSTIATSLTAFNSDGFTLGADGGPNANASSNVAWQWKANGGTTSSNSSGSITSTVQVNQNAGFSIVKYTGTGSNATVGHGLSTAPDFILIKILGTGTSWAIYSPYLENDTTRLMELNSTGAQLTSATYWNSTKPTSTVFSIGTYGGVNSSSSEFIAYCFTPTKGFSAFGSYTGSGNADGPFLYTGFQPGFTMIKRWDGTSNWNIHDSARSPYNPTVADLFANTNDDQETGNGNSIDYYANGFKMTNATNSLNGNGIAYLYMSFAKAPFVSTNNVAGTAG